MPETKRKRAALRLVKGAVPKVRCELCGKLAELTDVTDCCGRRVCYRLKYDFFISKQSCLVRHSRFTLCGYHHTEGHKGDWKTCAKCRGDFETEIYVYYGTNKWNFEKLPNPPAFEPTRCHRCGRVIALGTDAYAQSPDGRYACDRCWED